MITWLKNLFAGRTTRGSASKDPARAKSRRPRWKGGYDAAQDTAENRKHWQAADGNGPIFASAFYDRKVIRERARYEVANNSYAKGIVLTLANNLIGTGPTLQFNLPEEASNRRCEWAWSTWSKAIGLTAKLRVMKQAKTVDGETFGFLATNPSLPTSVKLDLKVLESDQVTTPQIVYRNWAQVDGIEYDEFGNPSIYHVLKGHPGDWWIGLNEYDRVAARSVLHWFREDRPGQPRGLSELTPSLNLFAQLRRFTLATLGAAETAANHAAVLKSMLDPNTDDDIDVPEPFEELEITRNMMTVLPPGWELGQFDVKHPTTTYEMFVKVLLREIARCLCMPWNIAAGDSSSYNYSSARLDHLLYRQCMLVEREDCTGDILERLFAAWLDEAVMVPGLLPEGIPALAANVPHTWHWPAWDFIDPVVEQQAATEALNTNRTESLASVIASRGGDWRQVIRQQEEEALYRDEVRAQLRAARNQTPAQTPEPAHAESQAA